MDCRHDVVIHWLTPFPRLLWLPHSREHSQKICTPPTCLFFLWTNIISSLIATQPEHNNIPIMCMMPSQRCHFWDQLKLYHKNILPFPVYILAKCHLFKCKKHVLEFQQLLKYASINLNYGIKHFYPSVPEVDHLILERGFITANPAITCHTTCSKMQFLPCQEVTPAWQKRHLATQVSTTMTLSMLSLCNK